MLPDSGELKTTIISMTVWSNTGLSITVEKKYFPKCTSTYKINDNFSQVCVKSYV